MDFIFKYIHRTRELFTELVNSLSTEQLNKIPDGFRNNIAWNFGHIIVSTQALCYLRSGVQPDIDIPFLHKYQRGTKPEGFISQQEIDTLKDQAVSSLSKIEEDIVKDVFADVIPFSTATYGYAMGSIEEVIACCLAHESLHLGYAMAQRKLITK